MHKIKIYPANDGSPITIEVQEAYETTYKGVPPVIEFKAKNGDKDSVRLNKDHVAAVVITPFGQRA